MIEREEMTDEENDTTHIPGVYLFENIYKGNKEGREAKGTSGRITKGEKIEKWERKIVK